MNNNPFNTASFIRPDVIGLKPYKPVVPIETLAAQLGVSPDEIIKLDANENLYGPSPRALEAVKNLRYLHIYPDPEANDLRQALSRYTGIPVDNLMVGSGADELIDMITRLFLRPGDKIINCPPTFGMYAICAGINGGQVVNVPRHTDQSLNVPAIETAIAEAAGAKLLFIPAPNNPDGSAISEAELRELLALPIVIALDEAYFEFHNRSFITWVLEHPNLIVLRTFSKWAGLAGLRVGYGAFPGAIIKHLWKIKAPYNVNVAAQAAALASLQDLDYLKANIAKITATRDKFQADLQQIPWLKAYPSYTNFVLVKALDRNAADVQSALAQEGILIRYYNSPGLQDHVRISIGTPSQMDKLIERLKKL
ncbi:MAG TPA: histidinol-phosphate transaminase [Chloroflexi bacterium]|nr:histidinol-phosphate transaminase [Chloroflexota bacterium]